MQQNNVYNPFSKDSKEMIRELGNVKLFELCETTPKVQCSHCLLYWNQGIVYCTCGQCRKALPTVHDTERVKNKENTTWLGMRGRDAVRKSPPKVKISQVFTIDFSEIRFIVNHNSQSDGQNKRCKEWDELAKEDHTYKLTPEEKGRYKGQWYLTLNSRQKWAYEASI